MPVAGRRKTYPVPNAGGIYVGFGDRNLLPSSIEVEVGEGPHPGGIDQLLFGARTTIIVPGAARLFDHPDPVESLMVPRRPMAVLWGSRTGHAGRMTAYRFALTASVWEIAGRQERGHARTAACLYFVKGPP